MKAISFLGTTRYSSTTYVFRPADGEAIAFETPYFAEALVHFFPELECVFVLVTPEVQVHENWEALQSRLGEKVTPVYIPTGHSESELWQIFNALTSVVHSNDTVIFDITNSFRSLPFLTFLAAAYLRTAQQVKVEAVLYGAFEARDQTTDRTPVFDLTPFVTLLDWITATNQFIYTGEGHYLAHLLSTTDTFVHPRRELTEKERKAEMRAKRIQGAAHAIEETSQALLTTLIPHSEQSSEQLVKRLAEATQDLADQAPPYRLLAERIQLTYAPFAMAAPMSDKIAEDLIRQYKMVRWYLDKGHLPQGFTLMREWMVTAVAHRLGLQSPEILDHKAERHEIEQALGWASRTQQNKALLRTPPSHWAKALQTFPEFEAIATFWNELTQWRNLIDHGAMRKNWAEYRVKTFVDKSEELYAQLKQMATALLGADLCG